MKTIPFLGPLHVLDHYLQGISLLGICCSPRAHYSYLKLMNLMSLCIAGFLLIQLNPLQIASGRHRQVMCALHPLIGAAVVSASQWRKLNLFMKSVVKGRQLFGVHCSRSLPVLGSLLRKQTSTYKLFNCDDIIFSSSLEIIGGD